MQDKIKELLEDGEELVGVTAPINFALIKRNHNISPYIIKGYDPSRNEFYPDKFFACVSLDIAKSYLQEIMQIAMIKASKMR